MLGSIFFKSDAHHTLFNSAITGKIYDGKLDPEYGAALYILTADLSIWQRVQSYVLRDGILFDSILEEVDFSHGYSVLVRLASNLFNGNIHLDPLDLMILDEDNFNLAIDAIKLRRYGSRSE